MDFLPVGYSEADYIRYEYLFRLCFPKANKFSRQYLDWLYRQNPDGYAVGFDAFDGDQLVAHYACIPSRTMVGGKEVTALLSLNTATHPNYQGKGLFAKLAEMTYRLGSELGYDCVYGVANSNSTSGFINRLNFQLVGPLIARAGLGAPKIHFSRLDTHRIFRRLWSPEALAWRCTNPSNPVTVNPSNSCTTFLAPALLNGRAFVVAELEQSVVPDDQTAMPPFSPLRLFIGMVPPPARQIALYVDIPDRFRPSPLNLVFRSLSSHPHKLDPNAVFFSFLDFDAY